MRPLLRIVRCGLAALVVALPVLAQEREAPAERVSLVADSVTYDTNTGLVVAEGAVEVYYGQRTLTADKVVYDSNAETISAEGDITLREPDGEITIYADLAELDTRLRDGLVLGARSVMGQDVKLSAVEARRIDDRYNALSKAVYSPCRVCPEDPTPLWRIRARRVIHDEEDRVIHYEGAWFDFLGTPVLYLPYFRHADPTIRRKSGFLTPSVRQSSVYGWGARTPYYWVIDEHSDATIEPFFTTQDRTILIGEYRRRFVAGDFEIAGSITRNDYQGSEEFHGNLQALGDFETFGGTNWGFDIDIVTDDAYLRRFDFSDDDRLTSEAYVWDYQADQFFEVAGVFFQSLRDDEPDGQVPFVLPDAQARYEFAEPFLAGELALFADTAAVVRTDGEDAVRVTGGGDWERQFILPSGLLLEPFAEARIDLFASGGTARFDDDNKARFHPMAGVEIRYPLINDTSPVATHVVEPIAQAIVAPYGGNRSLPNEDSLLTEFDMTSLFERNHFPGLDAVEEGPRLNLGLRYERIALDGVDFDASVGRSLRPKDADEFSVGSGLVNKASDWVGGWSASYDPYFTVRQRLRLGEGLDLTRNEVFGGFEFDPVGLDVGYIFLEKDPRINAPADREEISGAARLQLTDHWSLGGFLQHDIGRGQMVETGGSLSYRSECLALSLGIEQRFTDREDAPESLSFVIDLELLTLGSDPDDGPPPDSRCTVESRT